jgi:phenylacetate-CoA ligase
VTTCATATSRSLEDLLLTEFRRAAGAVPAYQALLAERGIRTIQVADLASFARLCPVLSKANTFDRFPIDQLSVGGSVRDVADILTSSGHGGRFSFGLITRQEAAAAAQMVDRAFAEAFDIDARTTLAINCLPMGVVFSSNRMTVATTSVREDMAVALVEAFGHRYEQLVLVGDPLFMKRLTDYATARGVDWSRHRVNVVLGEEVFGEYFRAYLAACLGLDAAGSDGGYIMSSFGVGELGLHLCYETRSTLALRRAALDHPAFADDLLGARRDEGSLLPMIFTFNPARTFIEVLEPDARGYGLLTISMLDPERTVPLLRYQTGDIARLLDREEIADAVRRHDVVLPGLLPAALVALKGRQNESLPNGSHAGLYKDALYADRNIARRITGAFRVIFSAGRCTLHVQLARSEVAPASLEQTLAALLPPALRPVRVVLWEYRQFPFGMGVDYERKFTYYVAGETSPETDGAAAPGRPVA